VILFPVLFFNQSFSSQGGKVDLRGLQTWLLDITISQPDGKISLLTAALNQGEENAVVNYGICK
jgi:hypothetical protein